MYSWPLCAVNVTVSLQNKQDTAANSQINSNSGLELSFEYLMSKDKLQWITIASEQAILMSVCLQSLVDELLIKKNGVQKRITVKRGNWSYMKRDGSFHLISNDIEPKVLSFYYFKLN